MISRKEYEKRYEQRAVELGAKLSALNYPRMDDYRYSNITPEEAAETEHGCLSEQTDVISQA
jgi:hypothetical protein